MTTFPVPISFKILWLINNFTPQFAFPLLCLHLGKKQKKNQPLALQYSSVNRKGQQQLHYLETSTTWTFTERRQGRETSDDSVHAIKPYAPDH